MSEQFEKLYHKSIRALSRREYSSKELASFLMQQCSNHSLVSSLINQLQNKGYLSDERFVESVCRSYSQKYGAAYIKMFLERHDISKEKIEHHLTQIAKEEIHVAQKLLEKKRNMPIEKRKALLQRKGFSWKTIEELTRSKK